MSLFSAEKGLGLYTGMGRRDTEAVRIRKAGRWLWRRRRQRPGRCADGRRRSAAQRPPHRFLVKTGASGSGNLRKSSRGQRKQKSVRILCLSFLQAAGVAMATKMKERMIYNETGKRIQERSVL